MSQADFKLRRYSPQNEFGVISHESLADGTGRATSEPVQFMLGYTGNLPAGTVNVDSENEGVVIAGQPKSHHAFTRGWAVLDPNGTGFDAGSDYTKQKVEESVRMSPGVITPGGEMKFVIQSYAKNSSVTINFIIEYKALA